MKQQLILLKPAVEIEARVDQILLHYRGQHLTLDTSEAHAFTRIQSRLDGSQGFDELAKAAAGAEGVLASLQRAAMIVALPERGAPPENGADMTGEWAFWQLEAELCRRKFGSSRKPVLHALDAALARGEARSEVAEGYLIELGYLMRHVPRELSLAVASAPNHEVRMLYTKFFVEECFHGQLMVDQLIKWIPAERLFAMRPLPTTVAVLNLYCALASAGPLHYAVALMHDEGSLLDPQVPPEDDLYAGLSRHFKVPENVVAVFRWHANLDRTSGHGFFPLEIFRAMGRVDAALLTELRGELATLFETRALWRRELAEFYGSASIHDRCP